MPLNSESIWIYDEFEDAAPFSTLLNKLGQSVSDRLASIGAWQDYTPSLTNVNIGNGSVFGRYTLIGDTVRGVAQLSFGSTTSVTDIIRVGFPLPIRLATHPQNAGPIGNAVASDTTNRAYGTVSAGGTNDMRFGGVTNGTFTNLSWDANAPFTSWGAGYSIWATFEYERA